MAKSLERLWVDYEEHHRAIGNQWCHLVGIPLIILGVLGSLSFQVFRAGALSVEASLLLVLAAGVAYLWLDPRLGVAMAVALVVFYWGARELSWQAALALFVVGWALQFIGHGVYEKRSPAFFGNLAHLLVGPLWVLNYAVRIRRR
jgi:uncharacterized membrane protein YGL010W